MGAAFDAVSVKLLLLLLSLAFGAWSWSIYEAIEKVDKVFEQVTTMSGRMEYLVQEMNEHKGQPWHSEAGQAIIRLQERQLHSRTRP